MYLHSPDGAHNLSPAQIRALEAIQVAGASGDFLLESGRVLHHVNRFVDVKVGLPITRCDSAQGFPGLFDLSFTDEPPVEVRMWMMAQIGEYVGLPR